MGDVSDTTRRGALTLGLGAATALAVPVAAAALTGPASATAASTASARGVEGQRIADLGNGLYRNPVLSGDRADPNVLKDGADYYAAFSSFLYYPAIVVWHSRDLVDWRPLAPALTKPIGSVFAVDLAKHDGRYFIYIPVFVPPAGPPKGPPFKIYVVHATDMAGPWSEPVDMGIDGFIDPGHVVGEDGHRYLFLNDGHRVRISDDGLSRAGPTEKVYDGWPIPEDWIVEGFALEGPKLLRRDGYFYLFSGEGGTAGPPTSHMVIVARSRSIDGPWENCPHNPIVHTASRDEPWWSRGHATPVEGPAGDWWLVYHGYENGFRTLGRQMLLEPMTWEADGWPRARGGDLSRALPRPRTAAAATAAAPGAAADGGGRGVALSTDFAGKTLGPAFAFFDPRPDYATRVTLKDNALILRGQGAGAGTGTGPAHSSPLAFVAGDRSYAVTIDVDLNDAGEAGLLLFYNDALFCGLGVSGGRLHLYRNGTEQLFPPAPAIDARRLRMRVVNDENVATFSYSTDGARWTKAASFEVSGYNHNIGDGFLSLRPALYASGEGAAIFRTLRYRALAAPSAAGRATPPARG